ncbi:MAG TPA: hypothetical protein VK498_13245 [Ferruginibacter sp.]|nr:hypothetical protein [Ferruginibacter sp.]
MKFLLTIILVALPAFHFAQINSHLTAVYESRKKSVKVKWQNSGNVNSYVLQRSADNREWKDIARIGAAVLIKNAFISYNDEGSGKNYYRLKIYNTKTSWEFSTVVMVINPAPGYNWIMYPVPVLDVLNLQYNGSELIPGVISVFIQSIEGKVYTRLRLASTTRQIQIPVSNLGRGTYDIRVVIMDEVVWNQRFIK